MRTRPHLMLGRDSHLVLRRDLAVSKCRSHETRRSRWMLLDASVALNASVVLNACLTQVGLKIRAAYLGHWKAYKKTSSLFNCHRLTVFIIRSHVGEQKSSRAFKEIQKFLVFLPIYFEDFHRADGLKTKHRAASSSVVTAPTTTSGSPPQETPISGEWKMTFAITENTKRLYFLMKFKTFFELEQSMWGSHTRIWFVNVTLVLMSRTRIWRS